MKLEVGMYVRTENGIAKIINFEEKKDRDNVYLLNKDIIDEYEYLGCCVYDYKYYLDQILKASHNIIDLIELGDYVNGYRVYEIVGRYACLVNNTSYPFIDGSEIKSIVTKEQFKSMSYKVN